MVEAAPSVGGKIPLVLVLSSCWRRREQVLEELLDRELAIVQSQADRPRNNTSPSSDMIVSSFDATTSQNTMPCSAACSRF